MTAPAVGTTSGGSVRAPLKWATHATPAGTRTRGSKPSNEVEGRRRWVNVSAPKAAVIDGCIAAMPNSNRQVAPRISLASPGSASRRPCSAEDRS